METQTAGGPRLLATLNRFVEPAIRIGLGAPPRFPLGWWSGLVVMEIPGRKSGRLYRVPAFALAHRDLLVVSTVRAESQWIRNLAAVEGVELWLRGRRRHARSMVWSQRDPKTIDALRERIVFRNLGLWCEALDAAGALLVVEQGPRFNASI